VISDLLEIAQLGLIFALFAAIVFLAARSAFAGLAVVLATYLLFEVTSPRIIDYAGVAFGSISIYPMDVASLALLLVGVPRLFIRDLAGPARIALLTLVLCLLCHLVWGAVEFGLQPAIDSSRDWLPVVSGIVYGATVRGWDRRLPTAIIATGCALAAWSLVEVMRHGLYAANTFIKESGELVDARPVTAMGTLVMLQGLIFLLARGRFTLMTAGCIVLLASGIAVLQYRTLWLAAAVCIALAGFNLAVRHRAASERVVYFASAAALMVLPFLFWSISRVGTYQESFDSATGDSSTLQWRIEAWRTLLARHSHPLELVFGTPSGTGREIVVDGRMTNLNAHNIFVEALLLYGLIGLITLAALVALAVAHRDATARMLEITSGSIVILVVSVALVAVTHLPDQLQGLLLGVLVSAACFQPRRSTVTIGLERRRPQLAALR
jgi:hypothetical protein